MTMQLSETIKQKIRSWEGCSYRAYRCPSGVLTIGYGHTGKDVKPDSIISREEAERLFETDIQRFADGVGKIIGGVKLRQCQFDAIVSLAYNIGTVALAGSTLLKIVRENPDNPVIAGQFRRWIYGGGRILPGLVKRRQAEADHYFGK